MDNFAQFNFHHTQLLLKLDQVADVMRQCATAVDRVGEIDHIRATGSTALNPAAPPFSVADVAPRRKKRNADTSGDAKVNGKKKVPKNASDSAASKHPPSNNVHSDSNTCDDLKDEGPSAPPLPIDSLAPEPLPPLGRIVIPAIKHKHKLGIFTCLGEGLQKDGFAFQSVSDSLPRLHPVLTKAGKIAKRQPIPPKRSLIWWKAQCAFRGLKQQGKIEDLQNSLRNSEDRAGMLGELRTLEASLNIEFRRKNAAARDQRWSRLETDEEKADEDVERFLREKYRGTNPARDVVIIKTYARFALHAAAETLGLEHRSVEAPPAFDWRTERVDKWIIIGPNLSVVTTKAREVSQEAERMRRKIKDAREEHIKMRHAQLVSREGATSNVNWDVSGTWVIDCPYVLEQWGDQGQDECELVIGFSPASDGMRMWATFNFVVLTGVFRFARHGQPLDIEEEGDCDWYEDETREEDDFEEKDSPGPMPSTTMSVSDASQIQIVCPSSANRTWEYKWRGSETGEGELQIEFDSQIGSITFGGPGGTELIGEFESSLTGRVDFTGRKIGNDSVAVDDLSYEWKNSGEMEYERRRISRWH